MNVLIIDGVVPHEDSYVVHLGIYHLVSKSKKYCWVLDDKYRWRVKKEDVFYNGDCAKRAAMKKFKHSSKHITDIVIGPARYHSEKTAFVCD